MKKVTIISNIVGRGAEGIPVSATGGAAGAGVDLSGLLRKSVWDSVFEIKTDANGVSYILSKLNFVSQRGITAFGDPEGLAVGSIYDGLPIDNRTIYWDNGVLKAKGGEGGGGGVADSVAWVDVYGKPSWITENKPVYAYSEILNAPTMPTALSQLANDMGFVTEGTVNALRDTVAGKQDAITDLDVIRSGAYLGATAVQRDALAGYLPLSGANLERTMHIRKDAGGTLAQWYEIEHSGALEIGRSSDYTSLTMGVTDDNYGYIQCKCINVTSANDLVLQPAGGGLYYSRSLYRIWHEGNDGDGSGLDADTLDGMHGYSYFKSIPLTGDSVDFNNLTESGVYMNTVGNISDYQNAPFTYGYLLAFNTGNGYAQSLQIATSYSGDEIKVRQFWAGSWTPWKSLAFTDGNVASADKSALLQGIESDDFSGTDLELNMKLFSGVSAAAEGLFPYGSNANAVLTVNKHRGNYNSQLGFSSNGLLYYRNGSNEVLTTQPWRRIMFEGDNINILRGVDGKTLINSGNGFASIGDGYFNDGDILYINGKSIAMRSSDSTDLAINPSGDVDVTKNLKVAKNLTVNGAIVTSSATEVGATIVYPWGVDIIADYPAISFYFGKSGGITTRLIEKVAGVLYCEGTFIAEHGLQSLGTIFSAGDMVSNGHITSGGHVYIPNNSAVTIFDTNGVPHRSLMIDTDNALLVGHDTASATFPTFIDGNAIYFRYSNGHYTGMVLNASGNVGIGTTEPAYKLEVVSGAGNVAVFDSSSTSLESSILYKGSDGKSWAVGKGTGVTGDSFGFWSLTKSANVLMMRADGCVGIGTNDPRNELDILNNGEGLRLLSRNDKSVMLIQNVGGMNWEVGAMNNNIFAIRSTVWGGNVIVCNHSGDVGIGTSTLAARLNVGGTAFISGATSITGKLSVKSPIESYSDSNEKTTIYPWGVDIKAVNPSVNFFFNRGDSITARLIETSQGTLTCEGTFNTTHGLQVGSWLTTGGDITSGGNASISGNILVGGGVTMYSQRSLKNVVDERGLSLDELATIKPTRYTWKDGRDERVHIGGIADDVERVMPEVVRRTKDGVLTMDYACAAFAMSASLIQPVSEHERRIGELERENIALRTELELLRKGA